MSLTIYPLNLGEVEVDFSFLVWQTTCGNPTYVPATAWLITGADKPILVDAGFRSAEDVKAYSGLNARQSSEQTLEAQLSRHNLKPADIGYLVHTHLHLDHCGLDDQLPNARILLHTQQRRSFQFLSTIARTSPSWSVNSGIGSSCSMKRASCSPASVPSQPAGIHPRTR